MSGQQHLERERERAVVERAGDGAVVLQVPRHAPVGRYLCTYTHAVLCTVYTIMYPTTCPPALPTLPFLAFFRPAAGAPGTGRIESIHQGNEPRAADLPRRELSSRLCELISLFCCRATYRGYGLRHAVTPPSCLPVGAAWIILVVLCPCIRVRCI